MLPPSVGRMTSPAKSPKSLLSLFVAVVCCGVILLNPMAHAAPRPAQDKTVRTPHKSDELARLEPGIPIEKDLSAGQVQTFILQAQMGQFLHVEVQQLGIHVSLTLYGPDRKLIALREKPYAITGPQQISAVAKVNGAYTLEVASEENFSSPGAFRVSLDAPRDPSPADLGRIAAEQSFEDAANLYADGSVNSLLRAAKKYEESLPLWRSAGDLYEESVTLNMLGMVYIGLGEGQKALDYFNQALPLKRVAGVHPGEAKTLNNIGAIYNAMGDRGKALEEFNAALAYERGIGELTVQPATLTGIGTVYVELGQPAAALADFMEALPLARKLGDRRELPPLLNDIGMAYDDLGQKQKALDSYNQALAMDRTLFDLEGESKTLSNIGMVYDSLGDQHSALDTYGQALQIEKQLHARSEEAMTRNNIASVYDELGQREKALDSYHRALSIFHKLRDIDSEAKALNNIGFAYHNAGQDRKALAYYQQALPTLRSVDDRPASAMTLHNIGVSEDRLGQKQEALSNLNEGLLLFQEVQDPLGQGLTLGDLMAHFRDAGNSGSAIFFGKEAINSYQLVRRNISGLPGNLQKSFVASKESAYRELADLLITQGRLEEAEEVLNLLKREEYIQFIRGGEKDASSLTGPMPLTQTDSDMDLSIKGNIASIIAIRKEWDELHSKYDGQTSEEKQRMAELSEELKVATEKWNDICAELERQKPVDPNRHDPSLAEVVAGVQAVLRKLDPGTVVLYTLVGDKKYRIILATGEVTVTGEYAIGAADLRRKVFAFRQALQDTSKDPIPIAQELYQILLGPVAHELEIAKATTLMWSLDDALRYLPVSALHDGHDYLVARFRNEVFTTASTANLSDRPDVGTWLGLAMGISKKYGDFPALPSVRDELHRIVRQQDSPEDEGVMPGRTMLDEEFTEDNMKKALEKKYPLVHIASHFVFEPGNEANSYLLLGGDGAQGQHLSMKDIRETPEFEFHDTELLTLSACDTAMGGSVGEDGREVDGLGFLAQQIGAHAVVASLWAVNDKSTGFLMEEFYHLWTTTPGITKAEAIRQAQLMMLSGKITTEWNFDKASSNTTVEETSASTLRGVHPNFQAAPANYSHPYYWAPFILIGNWR